MKPHRIRIALFILAFFTLWLPPQARAEISIAVVDMQLLLNESSAAKNIQEKMKAKRDKFQAEFTAMEEKLRVKQKTLAEESKSLSQEEFAGQRKEFEQQLLAARSLVQKRKTSLESALTKALKTVEKKIYKIVETISLEKNYDLVLTRNNVLIGNKSLDISDEVMKKLNAAMSTVKLEIEEK